MKVVSNKTQLESLFMIMIGELPCSNFIFNDHTCYTGIFHDTSMPVCYNIPIFLNVLEASMLIYTDFIYTILLYVTGANEMVIPYCPLSH